MIARSNRNYENYFINGRYIKSGIIAKAIEEAYKPFMMQHKFPFALLHFAIEPEFLDVNVHPTKMELRFRDGEGDLQDGLGSISAGPVPQGADPRGSFSAGKQAEKKPGGLSLAGCGEPGAF